MGFGRPKQGMLRSWLLRAATLFLILGAATPVWAWGRIGHRVIARLAERQLNPRAKAAIVELLAPGESLADASVWADEHRRELPKSAPWHYVDVPLDEPRYHSIFSGDTPERGYVVDKIHDFRVVVKDSSQSTRGSPGRPSLPGSLCRGSPYADACRRQQRQGGKSHPGPLFRPRDEHAQPLG